MSPTCFNAYINALLTELRYSEIGINIGESPVNAEKLCVLAYADDIVLVAKTADELQKLLNIVNVWCHKWSVLINTNKTKVMHC